MKDYKIIIVGEPNSPKSAVALVLQKALQQSGAIVNIPEALDAKMAKRKESWADIKMNVTFETLDIPSNPNPHAINGRRPEYSDFGEEYEEAYTIARDKYDDWEIKDLDWEMVGRYYPDYSSSNQILETDILAKAYDGEEIETLSDINWILGLTDWRKYRAELYKDVWERTLEEKSEIEKTHKDLVIYGRLVNAVIKFGEAGEDYKVQTVDWLERLSRLERYLHKSTGELWVPVDGAKEILEPHFDKIQHYSINEIRRIAKDEFNILS